MTNINTNQAITVVFQGIEANGRSFAQDIAGHGLTDIGDIYKEGTNRMNNEKGKCAMTTETNNATTAVIVEDITPLLFASGKDLKRYRTRDSVKASCSSQIYRIFESHPFTPEEIPAEVLECLPEYQQKYLFKRYSLFMTVKAQLESEFNKQISYETLESLRAITRTSKLTWSQKRTLMIEAGRELVQNPQWTKHGNAFWIEKQIDEELRARRTKNVSKQVLPSSIRSSPFNDLINIFFKLEAV